VATNEENALVGKLGRDPVNVNIPQIGFGSAGKCQLDLISAPGLGG
jgi:hypothetical protein